MQFKKRVKLFPGIHLNISHKGLGLNLGTNGLNVGINKNGVQRTIGIPGTGLFDRKKIYEFKNKSQVNLNDKLPLETLKMIYREDRNLFLLLANKWYTDDIMYYTDVFYPILEDEKK